MVAPGEAVCFAGVTSNLPHRDQANVHQRTSDEGQEDAHACAGIDEGVVTFGKAVVAAGVLPVRHKELIAIAMTLATQCPYCIDIHIGNARKAGASDAEITGAAMVACALRAGIAVIHAATTLSDPQSADNVLKHDPNQVRSWLARRFIEPSSAAGGGRTGLPAGCRMVL